MFGDLYGYQFQQTNRQTQNLQSREFTSRNPKTIAFPSDKHSRPIITFKWPTIKLTKSNRPDSSHLPTSSAKILQKKNKTLITHIFRSQKNFFFFFFKILPEFSRFSEILQNSLKSFTTFKFFFQNLSKICKSDKNFQKKLTANTFSIYLMKIIISKLNHQDKSSIPKTKLSPKIALVLG